MIESATLKWLLSMALRSPTAWLVAAGVGAAWPIFVVLLSLGVTTSSQPPAAALYELGFLAAQLGAMLAIVTLSQGSWWLSRSTPWRRFRAEFTGVATASFVLVLATWLLPVLTSLPGGNLPLTHMLSSALLGSLHLAAVGVCILAFPIGALGRATLIPLAVWFIPSLIDGHSWALVGIRQCFELAGDFKFPWTEESSASVWQASVLPILGLCLLRLAGATRRALSPCDTPS